MNRKDSTQMQNSSNTGPTKDLKMSNHGRVRKRNSLSYEPSTKKNSDSSSNATNRRRSLQDGTRNDISKCNGSEHSTTRRRNSVSYTPTSKSSLSRSSSKRSVTNHVSPTTKSSSLGSSRKKSSGSSSKDEKSRRKSSKREKKDLLRLELLKAKFEEASKIEYALKQIEIEKIAKLNKIREQLLISEEGCQNSKKTPLYKKIREKQKQNESLRRKNKLIQCSIFKIKTNNPLREDDYGFNDNDDSDADQENMSPVKQLYLETKINKLKENKRIIKKNLYKYRSNVGVVRQNCNNALLVYLCENKRKRVYQDCIEKIILTSKKQLKKKSYEKLIKDVLLEKKNCEQSSANTKNNAFHIGAGAFLSFKDEINLRSRNAAAKIIQMYVRGERKIVVKSKKRKGKSRRNSLTNFISPVQEDDDVFDETSMPDSIVSCEHSILSFRIPNKTGAVLKKFSKINMDDVMSRQSKDLEDSDSDVEKGKIDKTMLKSKLAHRRKQFQKGLSLKFSRIKCPFGYNEKLIDSDYSDEEMDFTDVMSLSSEQTPMLQ